MRCDKHDKMKTTLCFSTWSLLLVTNFTTANPLTFFQTVLRYYHGNINSEGYILDTPGEKILREKEYDFIVIGSGSAGSVVANRLSENPDWTVLLLEAGKDECFLTDIPIFVNYFQLTDYNWGYTTQPQENVCHAMVEQRCRWPRGKVLGGTSVLNYMIYTRGNNKDYDEWAQLGNTGWSYDELLPYFKKSENLQIPELMNSQYHSSGGYLNVESIPFRTPLAKAFIDAAQEAGLSTVDYNGEEQIGASYIQGTVRKGRRCSAAKAFLRPVRERRNLHISLNSRVTKIIIDPSSKRVRGVEFIKNKLVHRVTLKKEVILSAGALNSPQLLMLSGIGPQEHLHELGIPVIQNLKVGHNLQDHVTFLGATFLINETLSIMERRVQTPQSVLQYVRNFSGPMSVPSAAEGLLFTRTKYAEDERPDLELIYVSGSVTSDAGGAVRRGIGITDDFYNSVFRSIDFNDTWSMWPMLLRPKSRGVIRLKSKNPLQWPEFYPNFLSDPLGMDIKILIEGIKMAIDISKTSAFRRYDSKLHDTPIPGCSHLTFGSDEYWVCAIRYLGNTLHHQCCTCKMGPPSDPDSVVDPTLRVYGVQGLRVADASIIPLMPSGHLNAPAIMIGEKVSDLIKQHWSTK